LPPHGPFAVSFACASARTGLATIAAAASIVRESMIAIEIEGIVMSPVYIGLRCICLQEFDRA